MNRRVLLTLFSMILETDFLSDDTLIEIVGTRKMPPLNLLAVQVPALSPLARVTVPLWVAVIYKSKHRCKIICPKWMTIEKLEEALKQEQAREEFSAMPFHYLEIASSLLDW